MSGVWRARMSGTTLFVIVFGVGSLTPFWGVQHARWWEVGSSRSTNLWEWMSRIEEQDRIAHEKSSHLVADQFGNIVATAVLTGLSLAAWSLGFWCCNRPPEDAQREDYGDQSPNQTGNLE